MPTRQNLALLTFGTALFASVATSPARWQLEDRQQGAEIALTDEAPDRSLSIELATDDIPTDAYGDLWVSIEVLEALGTADEELTLDFVLVQETVTGDVEIEAITDWKLEPATEENATPEFVSFSVYDIPREGTWRLDVTKNAPGSARFDWLAEVSFRLDGETDVPGEPAITVALDPAE